MDYKMSFQDLAKLQMDQLSKQPSSTLEEKRAQVNSDKKASEEAFLKLAPEIQKALPELIKTPLSIIDKGHIYMWLCRNQITIEMLSKEVFDEFKETKQYKEFIERSTTL